VQLVFNLVGKNYNPHTVSTLFALAQQAAQQHKVTIIIQNNWQLPEAAVGNIVNIPITKNKFLAALLLKTKVIAAIKKIPYQAVISINHLNLPNCYTFTPIYIPPKKNTNNKPITLLNTSTQNVPQIVAAILPIYQPLNFLQQENFRQTNLGGKDYFLVALNDTTTQNFVTILKAFTYFKGWQRSNLQLVILLPQNPTPQLQKLYNNYKYHADVLLVVNNQPLTPQTHYNWLSAAYAFIAVNTAQQYPINILQSMACWVPACSVQHSITQNIFTTHLNYFALTTEKPLAQLLIQLYKNEVFRQQQVQQGNTFLQAYNLQTNNWQQLI
jgi:hypothetical protein